MYRKLLAATAGLAVVGAAITTTGASVAAAAPAPITPTLPAPTGPHQVGERTVHLVDRSRHDPFVPKQPYRELMASVFYPAKDVQGHPIAPQMTPGAAKHFATGVTVQDDQLPTKGVNWAGIRSHSYVDAPVAGRRLPVLLYSPGLGDDRTWNTAAVEDLASRGYAVVTIDHTYESSEVEFPGGRIVPSLLPKLLSEAKDPITVLRTVMSTNVADTKYVLDELPHLLGGALDTHRVGMFGHSAGGFTAAEAMYEDHRIAAGLNMDGTLAFTEDDGDGSNPSLVAQHGLDRPFLLYGSKTNDHYTQASWSQFWQHDHAWKRDLLLRGAEHASFTDAESIVPQLHLSSARETIGFVQPQRAIANTRAYVAAFFDRWLRHGNGHLLGGASRDYPETVFVP